MTITQFHPSVIGMRGCLRSTRKQGTQGYYRSKLELIFEYLYTL